MRAEKLPSNLVKNKDEPPGEPCQFEGQPCAGKPPGGAPALLSSCRVRNSLPSRERSGSRGRLGPWLPYAASPQLLRNSGLSPRFQLLHYFLEEQSLLGIELFFGSLPRGRSGSNLREWSGRRSLLGSW
jgi:hypothetical protein